MVERMTVNHVVAGSSPAVGAIRGISSVGRTPALQAGGQRFKSAILHQIYADVAQMVERRTCNARVGRSNRLVSSTQ